MTGNKNPDQIFTLQGTVFKEEPLDSGAEHSATSVPVPQKSSFSTLQCRSQTLVKHKPIYFCFVCQPILSSHSTVHKTAIVFKSVLLDVLSTSFHQLLMCSLKGPIFYYD